MIRPYIIDPLESSSIHLDLTLVAEAFPEDNDKEKSKNVKAKYLYIASLEPAKQ